MAVLLARGQITIVAIKDGKDGAQGKDYWQQDVWVDLSAAEYDRNVWYPVVGGALPSGGFVGIKVSVGLNSGTKPSWSTHSAGFSVDFHIDTQRSGWGETPGETIIYTDNYAWCPVSPVSYRQLSNDSRPVLYLRGGGKYRVIATIAIEWKIYKDGYTWQSGQYSQSAMPQNSRPTPEGHTLKGDKGDKGNPGKDSITWTLTPDTITYDTDDSGKAINVGTGKTTTLRVLRGNDELTNFTIKGVKNMVNCLASRLNNTNSFYISTITAQKVTLGTDTINVSCTNGSFDVEFDIDGITYTATAKFAVNVAAFTGIVAFDNKSYKSQFEKVSNRLNSTATKDELAQAKSEIEQTAREISLSVSEKSIARRNLLVGSDFRKQTNDFIISNDARIEMNSGYQGTNCIKVIDDTDGKPHYLGVYWDGSQGGKSIKIEKGKKYTISCWYFTNDTNASFYLEAIYTDKQTNGKRLGQVTYEASNNFSPKSDQWQLFTTVINTKDAKSDYIAFNFWECCNINAGRIVAYISRPMVEAGAEYNGWTLSDKDYDYVGANLIDNSRTFELGGNVIRVVGTKKLVGDAYELSATLGDDYNTFYEIDNTAFKLNTDYTISFEVKGDAKYMGVFVYYKPTNTPWAYCKEQQDNPLYEANGDGKTDGYGVLLEVKDLSDKQQKVWSHFKFKERLPESIYLQFPKNSEQTGVTSWSVTITRPKIEVGAVVTEYTERKSDLVDKASLKAAGVLVDSESVTLYGNQVHIKKNKTDTNDAVLIDTNTGKVSAALIDAKKIVADGIETQDLIISGSSRSPFSQAENGKDMSYSDNVFLQGKNEWINSYALKWDATQSGRLIRLANYNWNGNATSGYGKIKTPDASHFFFVNGEKRSQLYISEQEMVELLGIGDKTSFIGWAIVNRIHLNYYLNGMNVPILIMGKVEVFKNIYGNGYIISSEVQSFRGFGDYQGNNPTEVIDATRVDTGVYHLLLQPELAKYLYSTNVVVQATGIGNSLEDGNNPSSPIKATFNGIHFGSYPKYEGSYIEIWTSDDNTRNEGSFFIEVKCMDFFGINS
ncbi:hypothetical protein [Segatella hominis]|uniref:hypothetical protein n=1 Tax=Segatella hominis TaxID=2518605 RepID=UPI003AB93B39